MKFKYIKRDITKETEGLIIHGVNCQGVMGSGVALAIRKKWPKVYEDYMKVCKIINHPDKLLGRISFVENVGSSDLVVVNAFTQRNYGNDGQKYASLDAIKNCFNTLKLYSPLERYTIKMPMIGCGLGGLEWEDVKGVIESELKNHTDVIEVYYI